MSEALDIDDTLIEAKNLIKYLSGEIAKLQESDPMDVTLSDKANNLGVFKKLVVASTELNDLHSKRAVLITGFVEKVRHDVLDKGDFLPEDTFSDQRRVFNDQFKLLAEDYDQIQEDYFK